MKENKEINSVKKEPLFKRLFFSMSGYTSPTKALYKTIKESIDNNNEELGNDLYEATPNEINMAKRNLKIVCYICILAVLYSVFKLIGSNNLIDALFSSSVSLIITIVFLRNRYNLWILETKEKQSFKSWFGIVKNNPVELIP